MFINNSYVICSVHESNKENGKPKVGNITGLTMLDFVSLPPKARITISYTGEIGGEGFLGLKKL